MNEVVTPNQFGFIPNRNIHENIVVAQETLHSMHKLKGKRGYFTIKVDLTKTYDKMNRQFFEKVLMELRLPQNLRQIILASTTLVNMRTVWNGKKGLRQGDHLSSYLFVLCFDKLSHMIMDAMNIKEWGGMKMGRKMPRISHLIFAYDSLLFGEASVQQINTIIKVFSMFCDAYGQRVNVEKYSILFSKNT